MGWLKPWNSINLISGIITRQSLQFAARCCHHDLRGEMAKAVDLAIFSSSKVNHPLKVSLLPKSMNSCLGLSKWIVRFESPRLFLFQCQIENTDNIFNGKCYFSAYNDINLLLSSHHVRTISISKEKFCEIWNLMHFFLDLFIMLLFN